jgi:hypothetical protein
MKDTQTTELESRLKARIEKYIASLPKQIGDKVIFKGTSTFWFTDIVEFADEKLVVGKEYTIKDITASPSWTGVYLEEFPEQVLNYHWFD